MKAHSILHIESLDVSIARHVVCRDLSFALEAGQSLAILGRNGAGKSTLLAVLAGLLPAKSGHLKLCGKPLADYSLRELAQLRAWASQTPHDSFSSTVLETALIGRHPHLDRWAWEDSADRLIAAEALNRVGLSGFASRAVQTLSGGERQRLALASLLVQAPQLYLLDEPLSHLDMNHAMQTLTILAGEKHKGRSLVAVLHEPNLALRHFDHALLLFGDGSWTCGVSTEVINRDSLQRLYGHPVRALQDNGESWFIPE